MRFLIKLGIIGFIIYMVIKYTHIGENQVMYVMNMSGNVVTQQEVRSISRMIYSGFGEEEGVHFPDKSESYWVEYIRDNMQSAAKGRDRGKDIWQTPYRVRKRENGSRRGTSGFSVTSAGPDKTFDTADDISVSVTF